MTRHAPAAVLGRFPTVLLDFDGPICSIFSGFTSAEVAAALRERLGFETSTPDSTDPFDVLRAAAKDSFGSAAKAEQALAQLEMEAVASAEPTPGAFELGERLGRAAWVGRRPQHERTTWGCGNDDECESGGEHADRNYGVPVAQRQNVPDRVCQPRCAAGRPASEHLASNSVGHTDS